MFYNLVSVNYNMKVIPLGLQCSTPNGIKDANLREYSYPFDWLWTPSRTTFQILKILLEDGIEDAVNYMTTGFTYYRYLGDEKYISVDDTTECQMNKHSGLGITHFTINEEYKDKLKRRLTRLEKDIKTEKIVFVYADAASPERNYRLDDIVYGVDASEYLEKIYELILPYNKNIKILYFCWKERKGESKYIEYIPYEYQESWSKVTEIIKHYLTENLARLEYFTEFHHSQASGRA